MPFLRRSPSPDESAWAPLSIPIYRAFWFASLMSNLGTWIHETGAAWLMTQLDDSPLLVSSVRAAMALPLLILALPAGVLADRVDRRRLLIGTQTWMLSTAATLAALTWLELVTPSILLLLTGAMGLGMVLHAPTWQASVPELVPRAQLTSAIALGSISFNLARATGPAVGGLLVAWLGSWSAFAVNAGSFAGVLGVLIFWRRQESESAEGESFRAALFTGLRFAIQNQTMRHVLTRVALFVVPASGLWSLLPLVAHDLLDWDALGYGMLVGGIGVGAVVAAGFMPWARYRLGVPGTLLLAHCLAAIALLGIAANWGGPFTLGLMLAAGAGWMMALTSLNSTAQLVLPRNLRARGMSSYLAVFAASMSGGSLLWGAIARFAGLQISIMLAGVAVLLFAIIGRMFAGVGTDHS